MKWKRKAPYLFARECGRYTVDVFPVPGSATGERFTAWRLDPPTHLGCYDTKREAFAACARDIKARGQSDEQQPSVEKRS